MAESSTKPGENTERNPSDVRDQGRLHAAVSQTTEAARQVIDQSSQAARLVAETTADATRRTAEAATHVGERIVGAVKGTADSAADAVPRPVFWTQDCC